MRGGSAEADTAEEGGEEAGRAGRLVVEGGAPVTVLAGEQLAEGSSIVT